MATTTQNAKSNVTYWLKPKQVESMRSAAYDGQYGHRDEAIIILMYDTGLRRVEASRLDVGMLDLEAGELRIPGGIQKGYPTDSEPQPVTFELDKSGNLGTVKALRSYLDAADPTGDALFPSKHDNRIGGKGINDVIKRAAKRADVRPFTFQGQGDPSDVSSHTLRHSVAWRMLRLENGNTMYDVRNRLRHKSILTTERNYDHFETV